MQYRDLAGYYKKNLLTFYLAGSLTNLLRRNKLLHLFSNYEEPFNKVRDIIMNILF